MNQSGLQYYDFTLAPGKTVEIPAEGSYIRYYTGYALGLDESILVKGDTGAIQCPLKPGQAISLPGNVRSWFLSNKAGAATITGIVVVGNGEISDSQVAGSVNVINGEIARVKAGLVYMGSTGIAGAAGAYSICQLWNPAGTNKNLVLNKCSVFSASPQQVSISVYNAAFGSVSGAVLSKKIDAVGASVAQLRNGTSVSGIGSTMGQFGIEATYGSKDFQFSEPIVIPPGCGIIAHAQAFNITQWATFQWNEEAV